MAKKILVVDDDRSIGQILYVSFKSKGYETLIAKNGEEALKMFEEVEPDLVLLDVLLPKMNGWEVCQRIKETENGKATPVILMSAIYKSYKLQADARKKYGADDFVEKPFQLAGLLEKIYSFIGEGEIGEEGSEDAGEAAAAPPPPPPPPPVIEERPGTILDGMLSEYSFAALLHKIHVMGRSGILFLNHDGKSKEIAFKEGYPVSVKTNIEGEFLGRYLVSIRRITDEQCAESLKRMERSGRLQGTVLIEMGALTPNELVRYLKLQMRTKIFEVFEWPDGDYRFVEDDTVVGDITNIEMSPANIILRGVGTRVPVERLVEYVDRFAERHLARSTNTFYRFQDLDLSPSERELLHLIDGRRLVRDILAESELDLDKTYQILYTLLVTEMFEPLTNPVEQPEYHAEIEEAESEAEEPHIPDFKDVLREAGADPIDMTPAPASREPGPEAAPIDDIPGAPPPDEGDAGDTGFVMRDAAETPVGETADEDATGDEPQAGPTGDSTLRRAILDRYEKLADENHFQVLGVGEEANEHEVRVAYHKLAKEFHPDRFFGKVSSDVKEKAEGLFLRISEAYNALDTDEKIAAYKAELDGTAEKKPDAKMENVKAIIRAERNFQSAVQFMRDHNWEEAAKLFKEAMDDAPAEPEYQAYHGWALFNVGRRREQNAKTKGDLAAASDFQFQAREQLNRAIQASPRLEKGYVFLGYVYKMQGMKEFAERQFEKALLTNPNCVEALRELRLIRLQAQRAAAKKKTIFDKAKERAQKFFKRN